MAYRDSYLNQNDSYLDPIKDVKQDQDAVKTLNAGTSLPSSNVAPIWTRRNITAPDYTSNLEPARFNPNPLPTSAADVATVKNFSGSVPSSFPQNANEWGQNFGQTVGALTRSGLSAAGDLINRQILQPNINNAKAAVDFGRGAAGLGPFQLPSMSVSPINSAHAASPPQVAPTGTSYSGPMTRNPADEEWNLASRIGPSSQASPPTAPSGGAIVNGRTISPDEIRRLNNTNVISSDAFRNPGLGVIGEGTPTQAQGIRATELRRTLPEPGFFDPTEGEGRFKSDLADVLSKDPRSVLGRAAWNANVDLNHQGGMSRYGGRIPSEYQEALGALLNGPQSMLSSRADAGKQNARDQTSFANVVQTQEGDTNREQSRAAAENARTAATLSRQLDRYETDPVTGKVTLIRNGVAQPVVDAGGNAFSVNPSEDYTRLVGELAKNNIDAADVPKYIDAARSARNGTSAASTSPTKTDVDFLRQNPNYRDKFDAKFGKGAAAKALGNS